MHRLLIAVLALLALAGCGAENGSTDRFQGADREVADAVEDLEQAGERSRPEDICADMLARAFVDELEAGDTDCATEMDKAIDDADDFDLEVTDVTVTGTEATARVRTGDDGPTATFEFTREGGRWRATSLGTGSS
jgi:hypothetical protein